MHFRKLFPSRFLHAADLLDKYPKGVDVTLLAIASELIDTIEDQGGKKKRVKKKQPFLYFEPAGSKMMKLNITNAEAIAELHGSEMDNWIGKKVCIYPTKEDAFGKVFEVIRIKRPTGHSVDEELPQAESGEDYDEHGYGDEDPALTEALDGAGESEEEDSEEVLELE